MNLLRLLFLGLIVIGCTSADPYDPATHYTDAEQRHVLTSIVSYIYVAPPYTEMKDRLKPEFREFYKESSVKFDLDRMYPGFNNSHFYFVLRPGSRVDEKRGVGGHFVMNSDSTVSDFREVFVTPIMATEEAREKGRFLFDQMVKGKVKSFLKMPSYVQWPNDASYYDSTTYEWKMMLPDSTAAD